MAALWPFFMYDDPIPSQEGQTFSRLLQNIRRSIFSTIFRAVFLAQDLEVLTGVSAQTLRVAPKHELATYPDFLQSLFGIGIGFVTDDAYFCISVHRREIHTAFYFFLKKKCLSTAFCLVTRSSSRFYPNNSQALLG